MQWAAQNQPPHRGRGRPRLGGRRSLAGADRVLCSHPGGAFLEVTHQPRVLDWALFGLSHPPVTEVLRKAPMVEPPGPAWQEAGAALFASRVSVRGPTFPSVAPARRHRWKAAAASQVFALLSGLLCPPPSLTAHSQKGTAGPLATDVMHQNIYDYIHVDDRQDFRRQLHWAMDPPQVVFGQPPPSEAGDDAVLGRLLRAQEWGAGVPTEYSAFLTRCFVCRVRCLLDSTSGFLTMQFQGRLKFLFGQKKKAPSGAVLPPRLSLFCVAAPVLLPSATEMKMRSTLLRTKPRADAVAPTDAKVKATASLCESELHGKPSYSAGRSSRESGILVLREQTDTGRWAQVPARAPCPCLRGSPDLVLDPKGTSRDREEEQQRVLSRASGATGRREMPGPAKLLPWTAGRRSEDGARQKLQHSQSGLLSLRPTSRGSCLPYPCVQGTFNASGSGTFRNLPISQPPSPSPSAHAIRTSRASRDVSEDQVHPPLCHFPQGSLQHPQSEAQRLASRGYPTEDVKLRGMQMPPGGLCGPTLLLDVPIKMEKDAGSEDAAHGCVPSQVWGLGAGERSCPVTFPTRMPLKTEPDSLHQVYSAHLGYGVLGAQPHNRATAGRSRELARFHPAHCARQEPTHSLPQREPPHQLCARGRGEPSSLPSCTCRAAEAAPVVKREPLDSPQWAAYSQGRAPGMFPKSALTTLVPPQASECTFLP
ncbi:aryl hydrocarbon receptor repressor isoform X2 [Saimiri boliviensis]|uniref:aryl hydrocarbon receptor repressor isoform X2 n=1 Tax=Saimiri boliviensis TaxID=27679 RepID=UPI003D787257